MRKLAIVLCMSLVMASLPVSVYAVTEEQVKSLPTLTLPELTPLETPTLSNNYNDMLNELKKQGFGEYKYGKNGTLPLPSVEVPAGTGTTAFQTFKETYGDMWSDPNRQLDTTSCIPNDAFFAAVKDFGATAQSNFDAITAGDKTKMAELLKSKLDSSNQWDLKAIKNANSKLMSASQQASFLAGTAKPAGWDQIKANASVTPTISLVAPDPEGWKSGEVYNMLDMAENALGGNFFATANEALTKYTTGYKEAVAKTDAAVDALKQARDNGAEPTDEQLKAYADAAKNETSALLKPLNDGIQWLTDEAAKNSDEASAKLYASITEAEKKYGVGNIAFKNTLFNGVVVCKKGTWFSYSTAPVYLIPKPAGVSDSYAITDGPNKGNVYVTYAADSSGKFKMQVLNLEDGAMRYIMQSGY